MKIWKRVLAVILGWFSWGLVSDLAWAGQQFTYLPARDLLPDSGSYFSQNFGDLNHLRFPMESGPAYANSQVYNPGGQYGSMSVYPYGTSVSAASNFDYPWRDNYCEIRSYTTRYCASGTGHQGQDIRPATYADNTHWVVAVENGTVMNVNPFSSEVRIDTGNPLVRRYFYRHMKSIQVSVGQAVAVGQRLGRVSNVFGGTPTVYHLHLEMMMTVGGMFDLVPPYSFLVRAYERLIGQTGVPMYRPGQTVYAASTLNLRSVPGATTTSGYIGPATRGVILDGPQQAMLGGHWYTWWKVQWTTGQVGWVSDFLQVSRFSNGERVEVFGSGSAPVSFAVGGSPFVNMSNGSTGTILTDPISTYQSGVHLWRRVRWDIGQEGWVEEYYLKSSISSSCSAPMAFMARRGLLPRALAVQCTGSSPTPTATRTATRTPTRTTGIPGAPSATPTRVPTLVSTSTRTITPTPSIPQTATPTVGSLIFRDDFNRPDATVAGNGWFGLPPSLFIQSNRLVGGGIVTRTMPFQFPVRLKARLVSGGCGTEGGATNHFDHQISVMMDQYGSGGYGIYLFRADESVSTSQIILMNGSVLVDRIYAPVEFVGVVDLDATIFEDGSIRGAYRTQGIETPFSFPLRVMDQRGESLALRSYWPCQENFLAFDDLVLEAGLLNTPTPSQTPTPQNTATSVPSATVTKTKTATKTSVIIPSVTAVSTATWTRVVTVQPSPTSTPVVTPGSDCFQIHAASGCSDQACKDKVCYHPTLGNSACCGGGSSPHGWTASCVASARYHCRSTLTPSPTATPTPTAIPQNNCRVAHAGPGCTVPTCAQAVCARDSFCCGSYNGFWDQSCANTAIFLSGSNPASNC